MVFILFATLVIVLLVSGTFLLFGAPYVPTSDERLKTVLELASPSSGSRVVDLGSGDGRLVIAFARARAEAHGYELNPRLVWKARRAIRRAHLESRAFIHWQSLWRAELGSFDIVAVYGIRHIMGMLERKLKKELKSHATVVSVYFTFPSWAPEKTKNNIYLYRQK